MRHDPNRLLAVVGMAGRFPGAPDLDGFWQMLLDRTDAVGPVPADRWDPAGRLDPELQVPSVGGFLEGVGEFDAAFFGISPREAEVVDPQHRLMLEAAWRALEDAGVPASDIAGTRTGVYIGSSWHDYELLRAEHGAPTTQHSAFGNALDMAAARVSYFLKLTGPALVVETGCSSSLVALHLAAQALRLGEVDAAFVGGVNLILSPRGSIALTHFGGLSATGRCHAFSAAADGFVRGEGATALYIKTLSKALADGDPVRGVIVETAVNNDGGGESLVTPNGAAQEELLRAVYATAGVPLDEIAYIEAHGTGTRRGDPAEAGAIGRALGRGRSAARGPLAIGSVKSNIGHLEPAAGLAGLVKALLALEHGVVPASLHAEQPNPEIPFQELNVRVLNEPLELAEDGPVYLGVNSFGWGGTNAHAVVTRPPRDRSRTAHGGDDQPVLLTLSAHREDSLPQRAADLCQTLSAGSPGLADIASALARRRDHFPARLAVVARDQRTGSEALAKFARTADVQTPDVVTGKARTRGKTAFLFPGQGSQWRDMAKDLYTNDARFSTTIDRCAEALAPLVDWDLTAVLSGRFEQEWLSRVDIVQPALWATSVALAEVWRDAGVEPDVVIGHSQGEVSAATVIGSLSYADAAVVVARRSQILRQVVGRGAMLAVDLDVDEAARALAGFEDRVALAVVNGPRSCVLSGAADSVLVLKELLEADGVFCRLVDVDYASHSPQMTELYPALLKALSSVRPKAGEIPLMSTVTTGLLDGSEMDAEYWAANLQNPVRFADALDRLFDDGVTHVVEISPHPILSPAVEQLAALRADPPRVLSTLRRNEGSDVDLTRALARAYVSGLNPTKRLGRRPMVKVPGYPWQRRLHWFDTEGRPRTRLAHAELGFDLVPSATEQDVWEARFELGSGDAPWLPDHRVHEASVLPGAAMMALAANAATARAGQTPYVLSSIEFISDLTLGKSPRLLGIAWREDTGEGGAFRLASLTEADTAWTTHASAQVRFAPPAPTEVVFPDRMLESSGESVEDFYALCAARGLHYGPAFQGVRRLHHDRFEALGEAALPERFHVGAESYPLHPALWDAALQVGLKLYDGDGAVVPKSVDRVWLHQHLTSPVLTVWSHATLRADGRIDFQVFDGDRRPLMSIEGLQLVRLADQSAESSDEECLFRLEFIEAAEPVAESGPALQQPEAPGSWSLWSVPGTDQDDSTSRTLAETLASFGADLRGPGEESDTLVFVAPAADLATQRRGLKELAEIVRTALERGALPRVVIVTANAHAIGADRVPDAGAGLYWGFGRVLRREHPELQSVLIDIDPGESEWGPACVRTLLSPDDDDQIVVRSGKKYVGRLVHGLPLDPAAGKAPWARADSSFQLVVEQAGRWEGLAFEPLPRRVPEAGHIEIAVTAAALNFNDVMKAMGEKVDLRDNATLGWECAGVVAAVGPGAAGFEVGQRVVACVQPALASHVVVRSDHARHIPAALTDEEACALPMVMSTAWYALSDVAHLQPGETVLIHSAAGGLGLAAIQVAHLLGAEVIATASTEEKRQYLRDLGVAAVFDSRQLRWADGVREATASAGGVDVILNSLAGAAISAGLDLLTASGRFLEVGKKDIFAGRTISLSAFRKGISLSSIDLAALLTDHPERFATLFSTVWDLVGSKALQPLPITTYPIRETADALRVMSQGRHIGKLVVRDDPGAGTPTGPDRLRQGRFRTDGTYLVTGGLGALGLSVAEFLAAHGAGALVLIGRSAPDAAIAERLDALRTAGVQVWTSQVDVADEAAMAVLITRIHAGLPQLRGVVHAAGILEDATIRSIDAEQLERVLAPKVDGARHLDTLTAEDPLDFFVMFSSAAALIGNSGQAAYAAANAYLDTMAEARRGRGLPALSMQWGPFVDVGLAAQDDIRGERMADRGMAGFTVESAWPVLLRCIKADVQVAAYLRLDARRWFESYPDTAALRSWSVLKQSQDVDAHFWSATGDFLRRLDACTGPEHVELIESKVCEIAGRVLRLETAAIDRDVPFKSLGLDSLMSLEFRNRLEFEFGLRLSPTLLWAFGDVRALSRALDERLSADSPFRDEP